VFLLKEVSLVCSLAYRAKYAKQGQQTDVAITGDGYFMIEGKTGQLGMTRRGDLTLGPR
jgi:flagellar basal body rod protein FlgG